MKRADLIPPLFKTAVDEQLSCRNELSTAEEATLCLFYAVRETINIIWPFVGVPQVIPGCLGLAGYLQFHLENLILKNDRIRCGTLFSQSLSCQMQGLSSDASLLGITLDRTT